MSKSTEEYLEALYTITQDDQIASTSAISKRLKVKPASVTEMLGKLSDSGYIKYLPYQGATLTPKGFQIGEKITRKHRLLERFLHDMLKIGKDKVHGEACEMEHAISDATARALCQTLKSPDKCPDDEKAIPPCDFQFATCEECRQWHGGNLEKVGRRQASVVPLTGLKEGKEGTIAFIRGDNKVLRRLLDMGLTAGTKIGITRVAPIKGPVEITFRGSRVALGEEIAANVFIELAKVKAVGE